MKKLLKRKNYVKIVNYYLISIYLKFDASPNLNTLSNLKRAGVNQEKKNIREIANKIVKLFSDHP